jgi:hypothetical protein
MTAAREGEGFLVASGLSFFPLAFSFFFLLVKRVQEVPTPFLSHRCLLNGTCSCALCEGKYTHVHVKQLSL